MANLTMTVLVRLVWVIAAVSFTVVDSLTTADFVPYGLKHGDARLSPPFFRHKYRHNKGMPSIEFDVGFRIGKNVWKRFQISKDGVAILRFSQNSVGNFINPYESWVNDGVWKDQTGYGDVWYRITRDKTILSQLETQIHASSAHFESFTAGLAFVTTWHNVTFQGANEEGKRKRNTFQAVVVGDVAATETFAIYNYAKLEWTTRMGVNFGADPSTGLGESSHTYGRVNGYFLPGYKSDDVLQLTRTSNIGTAGRWIYKMSESRHFAQSGPEGFDGSCSECTGLLQCKGCKGNVINGCWCNFKSYKDEPCHEAKRTSHTTGIAGRPRHASLVELLIGTILTWEVGLVASGHGHSQLL